MPSAPFCCTRLPGVIWWVRYDIVPPNEVAVPLYFTISGKPPWPIFVHGPPAPLTVAGGHQVNFAAARPVWVANAPCLSRRNTAVFMPVFIVPIGASIRTAGGPVTVLLVANWRMPGSV